MQNATARRGIDLPFLRYQGIDRSRRRVLSLWLKVVLYSYAAITDAKKEITMEDRVCCLIRKRACSLFGSTG